MKSMYRAVALSVLLGFGAFWGLQREDARPVTSPTRNDAELFESVVGSMRQNQAYYPSMGRELRDRGYPVASVFNWRQPLLPYLHSSLTPAGARALSVLLGLALVFSSARLSVLAALSTFHACLGFFADSRLLLFPELWAGGCLGLSAVAFGVRRPSLGITLAVAGLFFRELAAPYCVVAFGYSAMRREWREVRLWLIGAAVYGAYFAVHAWLVRSQILAGDTQPISWLALSGLPFVVRTMQLTGLLFLLPPWGFAMAFGAATFAWWSPKMPWHVRSGVLAYALFFLAVGHPFNQYWGLMVSPLAGLWLAYVPDGIRAVFRQASPPARPQIIGSC